MLTSPEMKTSSQKGSRLRTILGLLRYFRGLKLYMAFNCLVGLIFNAIPIAISFLTSYMAGRLLAGETNKSFPILLTVLGLVIARAVFCYGDLWFSHDIAYRILIDIRQKIYERLEKCIPSFHKQMSSVEMATIATQDVEYLEWFYAHTINSSIISLVIAVAIIAAMFSIHIYFGLTLSISVILTYLIPYFFRRQSKKDGDKLREKNALLEESIGEGFQGLREVIGFDWNEKFVSSYKANEQEYVDACITDAIRRGKEAMVTEFIKGMTTLCLLLISALLLSRQSITIAYVPVVMSLSVLLFAPLAVFMGMTQQFSTIFAAAERTLSLLEFPLLNIQEGKLDFPAEIESVEFEQVSYRYPNTEEYVLKNVSFTLFGNEFVSLAGISGSGKSTIVNLLQRYIEPESGVIRLNGTDIREYSLQSWKKGYAIVRQDSYLFNLSISENILMNKPKGKMEEVRQASRWAQADTFISRLKEGYATGIGEKGSKLSGGEKQRIAIARALIKCTPFLILDEATANIDNQNETMLFDSIRDRKQRCLILSVAHKPRTIERSDRVIFLVNGEVAATGSFETLRETNPLFRKQILGIQENFVEAK